MRGDKYVEEVLAKCEALKRAGFWLGEPRMRPSAWINGFDLKDRPLAAALLDQFVFYDDKLTDRLLVASYHSLGDGAAKSAPTESTNAVLTNLHNAWFTPVEGEDPNRSDSGNEMCRRARQKLGVPQKRIADPNVALSSGLNGSPIVFLDDFVGSGDQFLETWRRPYRTEPPASFEDAAAAGHLLAAYVVLIATDYGLQQIRKHAPSVTICAAHVLDESSTVRNMKASPAYPRAGHASAVSRSVGEALGPRRRRQRPLLPSLPRDVAALAPRKLSMRTRPPALAGARAGLTRGSLAGSVERPELPRPRCSAQGLEKVSSRSQRPKG